MAWLTVSPLVLFAILNLIFVLVSCQDGDDHLLQGINNYRQSRKLPFLAKHDKADCLADEIARRMKDQSCPIRGETPPPEHQFGKYSKLLDKCDISINKTIEGVILPVCVPDRVDTLVLTNYTQSQNEEYLNNSKYIVTGIGNKDDWTVVILTTNTARGSFVSEAICLTSHDLLLSLLGLFLFYF